MASLPEAPQSHSPESVNGDEEKGGQAALFSFSRGLGAEGGRWPEKPEAMALAGTWALPLFGFLTRIDLPHQPPLVLPPRLGGGEQGH